MKSVQTQNSKNVHWVIPTGSDGIIEAFLLVATAKGDEMLSIALHGMTRPELDLLG